MKLETLVRDYIVELECAILEDCIPVTIHGDEGDVGSDSDEEVDEEDDNDDDDSEYDEYDDDY